MRVALLGLDIDRLVAVQRPHQDGQRQAFRVGARETAVAVGRPLHGRAHAVAVTQVHVVAHAQFVAVIQHRRAGHGQEQAVHQFNPAAVAFQQGGQTAADAQVDARAGVGGVDAPQIVAFAAGHHFQRQLVMVAQEDGPLAGFGNVRRLPDDVGDGKAVFLRNGHVHARHQRKVERHMAFVAGAEIFLRVLGPLVGFGQQQAVGIFLVDHRAYLLEHLVGLGQVLVVGAFAFHQIRHGVQAQSVHAHVQPVAHHRQHFFQHLRVVVVQVGLMRIEAVPEVGVGFGVPGPVGLFRVAKNDAGAGVGLVVVGPHVEIACRRTGARGARALKPAVLVRRMVDHQFGNDAQAARMRLADQFAYVGHGAVVGMHATVVGNVIAVVAPWRRVERQQPDRVHAQAGDVVQLHDQAGDVAHPVVIRVEERLHMQLVDDGVLVPKTVIFLGLGFTDHSGLRARSTMQGQAPDTIGLVGGQRHGARRVAPGVAAVRQQIFDFKMGGAVLAE
jgi:hypothetical protein